MTGESGDEAIIGHLMVPVCSAWVDRVLFGKSPTLTYHPWTTLDPKLHIRDVRYPSFVACVEKVEEPGDEASHCYSML